MFPEPNMELTHILVVSDFDRYSLDFGCLRYGLVGNHLCLQQHRRWFGTRRCRANDTRCQTGNVRVEERPGELHDLMFPILIISDEG